MVDKSKVMDGLRRCAEEGGHECECDGTCPYGEDGCVNALIRDALELLEGEADG